MTPEEKQRLVWICKEIQVEKDQKKFNNLVTELNELIAKKVLRMSDLPQSTTQS
jgi:ribonucleotide reductase beta subunit family protein with ferritin-like domain